MRKKMFLTLCCAISVIFLISYYLIYIIFCSQLMQDIQQQQQNILQYNEIIFTNYIDSFNMIPFQLINNNTIGDALNTDSTVYLDMFRAKEKLRREFNSYLNLLVFTSNLEGRLILYLNRDIPLSQYCDAHSLQEDTRLQSSQVYANTNVKNEEWYKRTMKVTWSPYFFLNEETNELCFAKCAQNYYLTTPTTRGVGIVVISIPTESILEQLFLESITPNSSIFLLNEYYEVLYQHGNFDSPENIDPSILHDSSTSLSIENKKYIVNTVSIRDDLYLTFLTPYSDIQTAARTSLRSYVIFSICTFIILIIIIYIISRRITAPIISFAELMASIEDTRTFNTDLLSDYKDEEIRILCNSFTELISKENMLIARIDEENRAKRAAVLHALQAQINPHFLYNALDVVSWMALSKQEDTIADVVSSISNMMHYSISRPDSSVPLRQELDNIQEFIRIYQLECPMDIVLTVAIRDDDLLSEIKIPKFTLQPLVENAILHNPDCSSLHVRIAVDERPAFLRISVTDNGEGADPEKLNAFLRYEDTDLVVSNGFGIRNVNERIQLHYSNFSGLSYEKTKDSQLKAVLTIYT